MPGAGTIYSDSFASQSRGTSNTISPSLVRIFHAIRQTEFDFMLLTLTLTLTLAVFCQMVLWPRNSNIIFEEKMA